MTIYYSQNDHNPFRKYRAEYSWSSGTRSSLNAEEIEENEKYEKYEKQYEQEQRRIADDQELIQNLREQTQASRTEIDSLQYELERTKVENQNALNDKLGNLESEFERVTKESDKKLEKVKKESDERERKSKQKLEKIKDDYQEKLKKQQESHQKEIQQMRFDALSSEEKQRVLEARKERKRKEKAAKELKNMQRLLDAGILKAQEDIEKKYAKSVFNAFQKYVSKQKEIEERKEELIRLKKLEELEERVRQENICEVDVLRDMYEKEEEKRLYQASLEWDRKHEEIMRKLQEIEGLLELRIEENCNKKAQVEKWRTENKKIMREDIDRQNKNRVIISVIVLHILFIYFAYQGYQDLL